MSPRYSRILVPVDFSAGSRAALEHAVFLAQRLNAAIDVLHVWQTPDDLPAESVRIAANGIRGGIGPRARDAAEQALAELVAPFARMGVPLRAESVFGQPVPVIRSKAEEGWYDLIVMGTLGRGGLPRLFLGSVAEALVRTAPCPVLTIRAAREEAGSEREPKARVA
jgi:nucleotide-binding universal stress UspA family protein